MGHALLLSARVDPQSPGSTVTGSPVSLTVSALFHGLVLRDSGTPQGQAEGPAGDRAGESFP
jgi:hypothetical protein